MFKQNTPRLTISFLIGGLSLILGLVVLVSYFQTTNRVATVGEDLKLKASPDKIVQYTEYDQNGQPLPAPSNGEENNTIHYTYVGDQEVRPDTYKGFKEDLSKRTPNSQAFLKSSKPISDDEVEETYVAKFYSSSKFTKLGTRWYKFESATTTKQAFLLQTKPTALTYVKSILGQPVFADTFFSGTGDGDIFNGNASYTTAHDAATGATASYTSQTINISSQPVLGVYGIYRGFLPFDTSSISSGATIQSATLNVYVTAASSNSGDGLDYFNVVQTTQPSATTLTTADYDLCGDAITNPTTGATAVSVGSITTSSYNTFTLNSTGLTWIAKSGVASSCGGGTGVTCLGIREAHDLVNTAPPSLSLTTKMTISSREDTSGEQDPYLEVTYSTVTFLTLKVDGGTLKVNGSTLKVN